MGLDITLLPVATRNSTLCLQVIRLERTLAIAGNIELLVKENGVDVPREGINSKVENSNNLVKDRYGNRIKSVTAGELCVAIKSGNLTKNFFIEAALAYMEALPEDWVVYVYFS